MKISIILAHPDKSSFNHAIAKTAVETLEGNGDSVSFHDLYEDGFSKLSSILDFSKEKNIKVVLVWSPQYTEVQKFKENQRRYVDSLITDVANKYKLDYLNFSTNDLVNDKSNFYNHSHLNYKGASEFSLQIASYIKNNTSF